MDFYELVNEINFLRQNQSLDIFSDSFNHSNRVNLVDSFDVEMFNLVKKAYDTIIVYLFDLKKENDKKK